MKPLYMWAGGKNKMIPKYMEKGKIPYSGYDTYVEPFFGGGAMMIHIAEKNPDIKRFVLNDVNPEIVGLYRAIKEDVVGFMGYCDELCLQYLPLDKAGRKIFYYEIRELYTKHYHDWGYIKEAGYLYFLMKTAFNGIFQSMKGCDGRFATPSGLLNQKDSVYDSENVMLWHKFLQKVDIYSGDWKECVSNIEGRAFYFFDPPYRDSFTQYGQVFGDDAHRDLIEYSKAVDADGHYVLYCNRDSGDTFYTDNQGSLGIEYFPVTYTAGRRKKTITATGDMFEAKPATEILLYSSSISPT